MSLKQKTISGLMWTFAQQFGGQIISFLVSVVLARLLQPAEFALIAMLSIFIAIGNSLMDSGLTASLIRTQNPSQNDYSSVFILNIAISIFIYFLLFYCAPFIADFYHAPKLVSILRVYTIIFVINAFVSVQSTILTKNMNFKTQLFIQLPASILGGIVGILFALNHFGVWSLVFMSLTQSFILAILHWIKSDWYPVLNFDFNRIKHHFKFGYKLLLSGLMDVSFENIYTILIGRFFLPSQLGFYNRAQSIQMLPVQNISSALQKVTYPLFSNIQGDNEQLKKVNKILMTQVIFWIVPVMLTLQVAAKPLFEFLFTSKWNGAIIYFKILCFYGILYPLHVYNLNILIAKGRSDLFLKIEIVKKVLFILGLFLFFKYGIVAMAWWQVIFSILCFFINTHYSGKIINYSAFSQLFDVLPYFILGFCIWSLLNYFYSVIDNNIKNNFLELITLSSIFFILYFGLAFIIKMQATKDLKKILTKNNS